MKKREKGKGENEINGVPLRRNGILLTPLEISRSLFLGERSFLL